MRVHVCLAGLALIALSTLGGCGGGGGGGGPLPGGPALDQENPLDGTLAGQAIGRFSDIDGTPDPGGATFDFQDAQSFTVGIAGQLTEIRVPLINLSGGTQAVTLEVFVADPAGLPDMTQSLGSVTIPAASIMTTFEPMNASLWARADVSGLNITVATGDQLAFAVRTTSTIGYLYNPESSMGYAGGIGARRNAAVTAAWGSNGTLDFGFQTFVTP